MNLAEEKFEYYCGDDRLQGVLIYDQNLTTPRPGVLLAPNMMGLTESNISHARKVAEAGYIVLAADLYGCVPGTAESAAEKMNTLKHSSAERERMQAGLAALQKVSWVEEEKLAAVGFCYGGHCVLELARSGAPLRAVFSLHGTLSTQSPAARNGFKGEVIVMNGAEDPLVSPDDIAGFSLEMARAQAGFRLINYAGAVHSFTYPRADVPGKMEYNETVCNHAFRTMFDILKEKFSA